MINPAMFFPVGHISYKLIVSDRSIFDSEGNEREGLALEGRRLLVMSRIVELERREEVALHEYGHAWEFHVPKPTTDEERMQFTAFVSQQFHQALESQGGREALMQMPVQRIQHFGKPRPTPTVEPSAFDFSAPDRLPCGTCDAEIMCGSIHHGEPELHAATKRTRMQRWFRCDACGAVQVWWEFCAADGTPSGELISVPKPRIIQGAEAARWVQDHCDTADA